MVLDNESCKVLGCTLHVDEIRETSTDFRNEQIREDWASGEWNIEELSSFWGVTPVSIYLIVGGVRRSRESNPSLKVSHS